MENLGEQIAADGFSTMAEIRDAQAAYGSYIATELTRQILAMRTVTGQAPA